MDGRGGCCVARYGGCVYDMSKIDRIMMRYRPIAPKPATADSVSGGSSPEVSDMSPKSGRRKRRCNNNINNSDSYSRRCNNGSNNRKRKAVSEEKVNKFVTLPLLPVTPDPKNPTPAGESLVELASSKQVKNLPIWLSFDNNAKNHESFGVSSVDRTSVMPLARSVVESCVTVEGVTETWVDLDGMGCTDVERTINLSKDTCPGFISDGYGRVTWTNEAYRKMVVGDDDDGREIGMWLVVKEGVLPLTAVTASSNRAFTCRVRVQNEKTSGSGNGKEKSSITVPCDAWRMDGGGYAWRLDVKAALCLGR